MHVKVVRTIKEIRNAGLCTGCGTCAGMCPNYAIKMVISSKGIYIPQIDNKNCNECGICFNVCPGNSVDFKGLNLEIFGKNPFNKLIGNYLNCYIGYAINYDMRYNSTSGGLVTQLLIYALEKGLINSALVTKMKYDNPLEPKPFIARTKAEIKEASKSKYCPVPANTMLKEILESKDNEKFIVVGLPCHIQGIRKAERINKNLRKKIVLHFALFCNHTPTFLATEYLLKKMRLKKEAIKKIDYRGKGWPGGMSIVLKNNRELFIPYFSLDYWGSVFNSFFFPIRCTLCNDKISDLADISFGDAWLPELVDDKIGTSLIISRSKIGEEILQNAIAEKKIKLTKVDVDNVLKSQGLYLVKKRLKARISLLKLFGTNIPIYDRKLLDSDFSDYFHGVLFYLLNYISSKRSLWRIINLHSKLIIFLSMIKRKLFIRSNQVTR